MPEWEEHIKRTEVGESHLTWCGESVVGWVFESIDHAAINNKKQGRLLPCKKCVEVVVKYLKQT